MLITVVVCTRNRARQIGEFLESAAALTPPSGAAWELVLIDNGSPDGSAEAASRFADRLPLRLFREERAGLSNARNAGVAQAHGDYICWTDDDVLLDPQWLAEDARAFVAQPDVALFGGPVLPRLIGDTPDWFHEGRPLLGGALGRESGSARRSDRSGPPRTAAVRRQLRRSVGCAAPANLRPGTRCLSRFSKARRRDQGDDRAASARLHGGVGAGRRGQPSHPGGPADTGVCRTVLPIRSGYVCVSDGQGGSRLHQCRSGRAAVETTLRSPRYPLSSLAPFGPIAAMAVYFIELNRLKGFRDAISGA